MPKYSYTAKSFRGKEEKGISRARNTHDLAKKLRVRGFILVKAQEEKEDKRKIKFTSPLGKVSLKEKMFFIRNLQVMTAAGLPLPKALGSLSEQSENQKLKKALLDIKEELTKGKSFSEAAANHPSIFSELFQNMIKVGEESGTLDQVLETLSFQMEKEHSLQSKIQSAMIYPSVIITAMLGVGIMMLVTVIPTLADTFRELEIELPATTKAVVAIAEFMAAKWYLFLGGTLILVAAIWHVMKIESIKKVVDKILLKIPVISQIIKSSNSAYMLRTLSSLITAGTSFPRALEITSGILGNFYFKEALQEGASKVRKGIKFSEILEPYRGVYPSVVIQMVKVGEETGETSQVLSKLADFFEKEVSRSTKNLTSVIEPVLMLIIGATIGFFAVSMIQPMYSMLEAI